MRPASIDMPPAIDLTDPKPGPSRGKRAVRILICLTQIIIALLLLSIIIIVTISYKRTPFIWYLLPLVVLILVIEFCHLFHRPIPRRISANLGAMKRLPVRAFVYQAAATVGLMRDNILVRGGPSWCNVYYDDLSIAVRILAWIIWALGVALFVLALVAKECDFEDWLEPVEGEGERTIQLGDSDSEDGDLIGPGLRDARHV